MRNAGSIAFVPLFVLCLSASGGVISTSVTCGITNNDPHNRHSQTQTSTSSCGLVDPTAQTALSSTGNVSAGPFFVNLRGTEYAGGPYFDGDFSWSNGAELFETASYTATILTDGPVRDGFVDLSVWMLTGSSPLNAVNTGVTFGDYFAARESRNGSCESGFNFRCTGEFLIPITLGVPIVVGVNGNIYGPLDGHDGFYAASASASLSFTFLELDQISQVGWTDITATPEPGAGWLAGFGIALIATRRLVTARKA
ncbi:MAG TPA: hypothetical protein VNX18_15865 [Bryobacteraceae bacterium]|jgi:hypothetical protein|nr:hypothetical protein [Bryobacteraceae bacterium]